MDNVGFWGTSQDFTGIIPDLLEWIAIRHLTQKVAEKGLLFTLKG